MSRGLGLVYKEIDYTELSTSVNMYFLSITINTTIILFVWGRGGGGGGNSKLVILVFTCFPRGLYSAANDPRLTCDQAFFFRRNVKV